MTQTWAAAKPATTIPTGNGYIWDRDASVEDSMLLAKFVPAIQPSRYPRSAQVVAPPMLPPQPAQRRPSDYRDMNRPAPTDATAQAHSRFLPFLPMDAQSPDIGMPPRRAQVQPGVSSSDPVQANPLPFSMLSPPNWLKSIDSQHPGAVNATRSAKTPQAIISMPQHGTATLAPRTEFSSPQVTRSLNTAYIQASVSSPGKGWIPTQSAVIAADPGARTYSANPTTTVAAKSASVDTIARSGGKVPLVTSVSACAELTKTMTGPQRSFIGKPLQPSGINKPSSFSFSTKYPGNIKIHRPPPAVSLHQGPARRTPSAERPGPPVNTSDAIVEPSKQPPKRPRQDIDFGPPSKKARTSKTHLEFKKPVLQAKHPSIEASRSSHSCSTARSDGVITHDVKGSGIPRRCFEQPQLFRGKLHGDSHVDSERDLNDEAEHSTLILPCANAAAHQDQGKPNGHGVCSTCRDNAATHISNTKLDICMTHWWPLCKTCGDFGLELASEGTHGKDGVKMGCSCLKTWLCYDCRMHERMVTKLRSGMEGQSMRQPGGKAFVDGTTPVMIFGWTCGCQKPIGRDSEVLRCAGCDGLKIGAWKPGIAAEEATYLCRKKCSLT